MRKPGESADGSRGRSSTSCTGRGSWTRVQDEQGASRCRPRLPSQRSPRLPRGRQALARADRRVDREALRGRVLGNARLHRGDRRGVGDRTGPREKEQRTTTASPARRQPAGEPAVRQLHRKHNGRHSLPIGSRSFEANAGRADHRRTTRWNSEEAIRLLAGRRGMRAQRNFRERGANGTPRDRKPPTMPTGTGGDPSPASETQDIDRNVTQQSSPRPRGEDLANTGVMPTPRQDRANLAPVSLERTFHVSALQTRGGRDPFDGPDRVASDGAGRRALGDPAADHGFERRDRSRRVVRTTAWRSSAPCLGRAVLLGCVPNSAPIMVPRPCLDTSDFALGAWR